MPPTEVPDSNINFPEAEEEILKLWEELDAFQTSLKQSKGKPKSSLSMMVLLSPLVYPTTDTQM